MFFKIAFLKNFSIFTGKHLGWSLFLIKLQAFRSNTESPTQELSCEYSEIFKNTFFIEHFRWLLLEMIKKETWKLRNVFQNIDCFLKIGINFGKHDYISEIKIILSNPYHNRDCGLVPLNKFPFYYSCRLNACIFTESKLFYNIRSSAARRCSGKHVILEISQNSWVNNCAYSLELYQRHATLLKELQVQVFCCNLCEFFKNTFFTKYLRGTASVIQK